MIKVTSIADLHGETPELPGGNLLIIAGDCTATDTVFQWAQFFKWFKEQEYEKKILVAGNHDGNLIGWNDLDNYVAEITDCTDFEYLCDNYTTFRGYKIYGFPWTPRFCDWHFMLSSSQLIEKAALIADDTDILVSHGPPKFILDQIWDERLGIEKNCGCGALRQAVERAKPMYHIFGHIHSCGDQVYKNGDTCFMNVAYMDEDYIPTGKITTFELEEKDD